MRIRRIDINNFRGIREAMLIFHGHTLLLGGNNVGKSTVCEAIDLVLGPERLSRQPPINEHDFYQSKYLSPTSGDAIEIGIEVVIGKLSEDVQRLFRANLEFWNKKDGEIVSGPGPAVTDVAEVEPVLGSVRESALTVSLVPHAK